MKTGIIIVDDHLAFRRVLRQHLSENSEFRVLDEFSDGSAVLRTSMNPQCGVLLLDISMPQVDGLTVLTQISERFPDIRTIIVSGRDEPIYRRVARERGAAGFVSKDAVYRDLIPAIRKVLAGGDSFPD